MSSVYVIRLLFRTAGFWRKTVYIEHLFSEDPFDKNDKYVPLAGFEPRVSLLRTKRPREDLRAHALNAR